MVPSSVYVYIDFTRSISLTPLPALTARRVPQSKADAEGAAEVSMVHEVKVGGAAH